MKLKPRSDGRRQGANKYRAHVSSMQKNTSGQRRRRRDRDEIGRRWADGWYSEYHP